MSASQIKSIIALCLVIVAASLAITIFGIHETQLKNWRIIPEKSNFTELYFNNHSDIRSKYKPGQTDNISFAVLNHENTTVAYKYEVIQRGDTLSDATVVESGVIALEPGHRHNEPVQITYVDALKTQVIVRISGITNQRIYYWTEAS